MTGTSLAVHWLRFLSSKSKDVGPILDWGTKISPAAQCDQKPKQIKTHSRLFFFFLSPILKKMTGKDLIQDG